MPCIDVDDGLSSAKPIEMMLIFCKRNDRYYPGGLVCCASVFYRVWLILCRNHFTTNNLPAVPNFSSVLINGLGRFLGGVGRLNAHTVEFASWRFVTASFSTRGDLGEAWSALPVRPLFRLCNLISAETLVLRRFRLVSLSCGSSRSITTCMNFILTWIYS